jgi:hypothetical protein
MDKILIVPIIYHYMGGRLVLIERNVLHDLSLTPKEAEEAARAQREIVLKAAKADGRGVTHV